MYCTRKCENSDESIDGLFWSKNEQVMDFFLA